MALKAYVDSLDGVAEAQRSLYVKTDDGKYRLDVDGVEDTGGLKSALQKERDNVTKATREAKEAKDAAEALRAQFGDMDPEQVKLVMSQLGNAEEAKLIKEGKFDQVFEKRTAKLRQDAERQQKAMQDAHEKALAESNTKAQKYAQGLLDNRIREAATKVGLHAQAVDDALFRGRTLFSLDDEGNAIQLKDGSPVFGKDGRTPFSPAEWLETMRESAPHWFPATGSGGGAASQRAAGGTGKKTITRSQFDGMDPASKQTFFREKGVVVD